MVRQVTAADGSLDHWSLRQVPEVQGGFMAMDVNTGRVMAMQGGFSYEDSVFNRATQAARQPGSSFKPFVYAAALDSGFTPATIVVDAPITVDTPQGLWTPKNSHDKYVGPAPMRTGIEQSRNLMTVRIAQDVGMGVVAGYAERFGVYDHLQPLLANALGAQETTLFKMTAAYAMFANGGERVEPTLVDRVQDRYGKTIYRHDARVCTDCATDSLPDGAGLDISSNRERVMNAITAYQLTSMMQGVIIRGTATGVHLPVAVAGKTGTTNDNIDAWFCGYNATQVGVAWIGFDQPRTLGTNETGGVAALPIWMSYMQRALKGVPEKPLTPPDGLITVRINADTGLRDESSSISEYFFAEFPPRGGGEGLAPTVPGKVTPDVRDQLF